MKPFRGSSSIKRWILVFMFLEELAELVLRMNFHQRGDFYLSSPPPALGFPIFNFRVSRTRNSKAVIICRSASVLARPASIFVS